MQQIETEINKITLKIDDIELLLKKPFKDWFEEEKLEFGNHEQLREERKQLRKKEEQLRDILILKEQRLQGIIISQITSGIAMDIDILPFDSAIYQSKNNQYFPFFDPVIEEYLISFGENALLSRDDAIKKVNQIISNRDIDKYQPIICSTSRGMGKTAFMEAIGMQLVKPHLKNQLILDALKYGRILSFDFAGSFSSSAVPNEEDIPTFFTRLMIYFLCRMFGGTQVDGIHFENISQFSDITNFIGRQNGFRFWLKKFLKYSADEMMDEYIRLTNLAFGVNCSSPPVFLLDEIQGLCKLTTVQSKIKDNHVLVVTYHSFLSLLLTQLAGKHKPVCICTGTNNGNIITIIERSKILPQFVSLSILHKKEDYTQFWNQRTEYKNISSKKFVKMAVDDDELFNSLVYASYQIPRLLLLAHVAWFNHKTDSNLKDKIAPLQSYEDNAISYYSEMSGFILNSEFSVNDISHIIMSCGVYWKVGDIFSSYVPGTKIVWNYLISNSLVFPYLDNCYIIPFGLMWAAKTPTHFQKGDYTRTIAGIKDRCESLISNFDINNLFVSYDQLRILDLYNLGMCYESLFASSLAVKYYLWKLVHPGNEPISILDIYNVESGDEKTMKTLSEIYVDFSSGIDLPEREASVYENLPPAVIHNRKTHNAHHDIILPTKNMGNIAVSCKASFKLPSDIKIKSQQKKSKTTYESVDLLMWLYLGNHQREDKYTNVVFINGDGCCNGLALDMFILTKRLISHNNK